jgi:hypothetical protein
MIDVERLAEEVRAGVVQSALTAYEDASMQGLCCEGAWEVALTAMRRVNLQHLVQQHQESGPE